MHVSARLYLQDAQAVSDNGVFDSILSTSDVLAFISTPVLHFIISNNMWVDCDVVLFTQYSGNQCHNNTYIPVILIHKCEYHHNEYYSKVGNYLLNSNDIKFVVHILFIRVRN